MSEGDGEDLGAPVFFLSHAHSTEGERGDYSRRMLLKFYADLSSHVVELTGRMTGADAGYLDQSRVGGQEWTPELLWAVGSCQVFIPLLSLRFSRSIWCGKEWDAFSRRRVQPRSAPASGHETAMLPVIWSLPPGTLLPQVVRRVQQFAPMNLLDDTIVGRYRQEGLYGLLNMHDDVAYDSVVWRLAQRVTEIAGSYRVAPDVRSDVADLRNVFEGER